MTTVDGLILGSSKLCPVVSEETLRSNELALSDVQITSIYQAILTMESGNNSLEAEISRLESRLDDCREALRQRSCYTFDYRRLVSVIRRVPREIWSQIFLIATRESFFTTKGCSFRVSSMPMVFTHVCRAWRETAVNTPRLWCLINKKISRTSVKSSRESLEIFIERSHKQPLIISVDTGLADGKSRPLLDFMETLMAHTDRWKHIAFEGSSDHFRRLFMREPLRCPLLESISLSAPFKDTIPEITTSLLADAPLTHVSIGQGLVCLISQNAFDWSELRSVEIRTRVDLLSVMRILTWATKTSEVMVDNFYDLGYASSISKIVHQGLKALKLINCECEDLFWKLEAPSLTRLEIERPQTGRQRFPHFITHAPELSEIQIPLQWYAGLEDSCRQHLHSLHLTVLGGWGKADILASLQLVTVDIGTLQMPSLKTLRVDLNVYLEDTEDFDHEYCAKLESLLISLCFQKPPDGLKLNKVSFSIKIVNHSTVPALFQNLKTVARESGDIHVSLAFRERSHS